MVLPGGLDGKESACNAGNPGSIPGSGRSPGKGNGNLLRYELITLTKFETRNLGPFLPHINFTEKKKKFRAMVSYPWLTVFQVEPLDSSMQIHHHHNEKEVKPWYRGWTSSISVEKG